MGTWNGRRWANRLKLLAPVAAAVVGLTTLRLLGPDVVDQQRLSLWLRPLGQYAALAFILLMAIRPLTLLPGQLFVALSGLLFGTVRGSVCSLVGSALAYAWVFGLARRLGTRPLRRMAGVRYPALRRLASRHDFRLAFLTTVNPLLPTDPVLALASASGARFVPTGLGMLLGTLPGTVLTAQFGSALGQGKAVLTVASALGLAVSLVLGALLGRRIYQELAAQAPAPGESRPRPTGEISPAARIR